LTEVKIRILDYANGRSRQMSELRYLDVPNFALQKGAVLPVARLAYRTLGTLNPAKDNAVLLTTGITLNDDLTEMYFCGADRALNPQKYFIILTNHLGNGRSSSPSNTPAPFEMPRFPTVTYFDSVRLQQLLVETLGIKRLRLVTGWSMGAAQVYQWASQYPDAVAAAAPIAGAARCGIYNAVFLHSLKSTLKLDPTFQSGYYNRSPIEGLRAFSAIYAGWAWSEPFYREKVYLSFGAKDYVQFVENIFVPFFQQADANDLLAQINKWLLGDISDNSIYNGDFDAALSAIKAKTIILPVDHDRYFPPVDAEYEASKIPNAECRIVRSNWGHMAPANPVDVPTFDGALKELLEG
jgi:homoserine O-acetyltransferase/O-succinyltransferase